MEKGLTTEQLDKMYLDMKKTFDEDLKIEEDIENLSLLITNKLAKNKKCMATVKDISYQFSARLIGKKIIILIADITKYRILGFKYRPYMATAEIDNRVSFNSNIKAVVEAFIRQQYGRIKAIES